MKSETLLAFCGLSSSSFPQAQKAFFTGCLVLLLAIRWKLELEPVMTSSSSCCGLACHGLMVDLVLVQVFLVPLETRCHIEGLASTGFSGLRDEPDHCQLSS